MKDYPAPAGGCLLTDQNFSKRLQDLFEHQNNPAERSLELLKYGRHFRVDQSTKIIVGRTKAENDQIEKKFDPSQDAIIKLQDYLGPIVMVSGAYCRDILLLAASICAGYSKAPESDPVKAIVKTPHGREIVQVIAVRPTEVRHLLI